MTDELAARRSYDERAAECSEQGHAFVNWDAPKLGIDKLLCERCGKTFDRPAVEGAPR